MPEISIAKDFSRAPGIRYRKNGPYSGEEFRETVLVPAFSKAREQGEVLTIILDGVAGYGSSFLEEAFGGLVRTGVSKDDVDRHLRIVAETQRFKHHQVRAMTYIADAFERREK